MTRTFHRVFRSSKKMHIFSRERDNLSLFCDVNCMNCTQCTRDDAPPQRAVTEVTGPTELVQFLHVFSLRYFRPCENWRLQITEERISLIWKGEQWLRRGEKKIDKPRWKEMFQLQWLSSWYVRACHITDFFEKMGHAKENVRNEISRVSIVRFMAKRTRLRYKTKRTKTIGKKRTALKVWKMCDTI